MPFQELFTRNAVELAYLDGRDNATLEVAIEHGATDPKKGLDLARKQVGFIW